MMGRSAPPTGQLTLGCFSSSIEVMNCSNSGSRRRCTNRKECENGAARIGLVCSQTSAIIGALRQVSFSVIQVRDDIDSARSIDSSLHLFTEGY